MRKGQLALLEKAGKNKYAADYMNYLQREDLSLTELRQAYNLFTFDRDGQMGLCEVADLLRSEGNDRFFYEVISAYNKNYESGMIVPDLTAKIIEVLKTSSNNGAEANFIIPLLGLGYPLADLYDVARRNRDMIQTCDMWWHGYLHEVSFTITASIHAYDIFQSAQPGDDLHLLEAYARKVDGGVLFREGAVRFALKNHIPVKEFSDFDYNPDAWRLTHITGIEHFPKEEFDRLRNNGRSDCRCFPDADGLQLLAKANLALEQPFDFAVSTCCYWREINISEHALGIALYKYNKACFFAKCQKWKPCGSVLHEISLVIFFNGGIYQQTKNKKLYPMPLKTLVSLREFGEVGRQVYQFLFTYGIKELHAPVLKDIDREIICSGACLPPIAMNECRDIHNLNQLCKTRWKLAEHINWNRNGVNLGYLILKTIPYLSAQDRRRLLELRDKSIVAQFVSNDKHFTCGGKSCSVQKTVAAFLTCYVLTNLNLENCEEEDDTRASLYDYFSMALFLHQTPRISFRSEKKILDAHDKLAVVYNEKKYIHKVRVPKDSRFHALRERLPKSFVWITDGKQLYAEGAEMGHCVNSYFDEINKDHCAIYSYYHVSGHGKKPVRVTIEFQQRKNGSYMVKQIQTKYNHGCPKEIQDYVKSLIA